MTKVDKMDRIRIGPNNTKVDKMDQIRIGPNNTKVDRRRSRQTKLEESGLNMTKWAEYRSLKKFSYKKNSKKLMTRVLTKSIFR